MHPIRAKRLKKQWSLETLGLITGLQPATLCRFEHCQRDPRLGVLRQLAAVFGCDVHDLIPSEAEEETIRQEARALTRRHARAAQQASQVLREESAALRARTHTTIETSTTLRAQRSPDPTTHT